MKCQNEEIVYNEDNIQRSKNEEKLIFDHKNKNCEVKEKTNKIHKMY